MMPQPETHPTQLKRKRKQLHDDLGPVGIALAKRAPHHRIFSSWEDEFFKGTENVVGLRKVWISNMEQHCLQFQYQDLEFVRSLNKVSYDAIAQAWLVRADSKAYAVKLFKPYTDEQAIPQANRLPRPRPTPQKVKHDASPFLQELRAYEQIRRFCPESNKHFFPEYHGTVRIPKTMYPVGCVHRLEGIVLSVLQPSLEHRRLYSVAAPETLRGDISVLEEELRALNLPLVEKKWYASVFKERCEKVMALHALGISHGDIKSDCFGIPDYVHDIALYDFSRSYTFTPERPCMTNGTRKLRSLKRAVEVDQRNIRLNTVELAGDRRLLTHFSNHLKVTKEEMDRLLRLPERMPPTCLDMIVLSVILGGDFPFFPSLSSILPFLEPSTSGQSPNWMISTIKCLDDFVALSDFGPRVNPTGTSKEKKTVSVVSSEGIILQELDIVFPSASTEVQRGISDTSLSLLGKLTCFTL